MNEFKQQLLFELASVVPLRLLTSGSHLPVLLPFYHLVSDDQKPWRRNYDYPGVKKFEEELDFLLAHFKPVALDELLSGRNLSGCFHLSFDDGLRECAEAVVPVLKRKGVPATFFINPSFVDNRDLFHRYKASEIVALLQQRNINLNLQQTYADLESLDGLAAEIGIDWDEWLEKHRPYLSLDQIRQLQADGFSIGSHSMDHPEFDLLDEETQLDEIRESMTWLTRKLNPPVKAFAFPFTDAGVSDTVFKTCRDEHVFDLSFGTAGLKKERQPRHFQRLPMERRMERSTNQRIKEAYLAYRIKWIMGQHYARR